MKNVSKPFFYIVCPAFNSSPFIGVAIESIQRQTYFNWILVVIDDSSTDNTYVIAKAKAADDKRIIVLRKNNEGPFLAREYGINYVKKIINNDDAYIMFLDSDDLFQDDAFQYLYNKIVSYNYVDFVCFNSRWIDINGLPRRPNYNISSEILLSSNIDILKESIFKNTYSYIWSVCIKAKLLFSKFSIPSSFCNARSCEDFIRLFEIYKISRKALYIDKSLYIHRDNPSSLIHSFGEKEWHDWLDITNYIYVETINIHNNIVESIPNKLVIGYCNQILYVIKKANLNKLNNIHMNSIFDFINSLYMFNMSFKINVNDNPVLNAIYCKKYKVANKLLKKMLFFEKIRYYKRFIISCSRSIKRFFYQKIKWSHIKNKDISLFCNNCISGYIYKKINIEIKSPLTWCLMLPKDIVKLMNNLNYYMSLDLVKSPPFEDEFKELGGTVVDFPCAYLGDLKLLFPHSLTFWDAAEKWNRRKARINYSNIAIIVFVEKGIQTIDFIDDYKKIPYKKIIITYKRIDNANHYVLACKDNLSWFNTIHGVKAYWELFDWKRFLDS